MKLHFQLCSALVLLLGFATATTDRHLEEAGLSAGQGATNIVISEHGSGASKHYEFSLETHIAAICGAAGTTTTWKGEICDAATGTVRWTSVETAVGAAAPTAACTFTRAAKVNETAFLNSYLGGCGIAPTAITIPMSVKTRRFEVTNGVASLCAGSTQSTVTWYGVPCSSDPNLIEWQYYHAHTAGTGHSCDSDPSQRVLHRNSATSAEVDDWFGSCGVEATKSGAPIHSNFITYQENNHQITQICSTVANPTHSMWVGQSCPNSAGIQWNRMFTPAPTACNTASILVWDRSDSTWAAGVPAFLGGCNTAPTFGAVAAILPTTLPNANQMTLTMDKSAYTCGEPVQFTVTNPSFYNPTAEDEIYFAHSDGTTERMTKAWDNMVYDAYQIQDLTREVPGFLLGKDGTWTVSFRRAGTDVIASATITLSGC